MEITLLIMENHGIVFLNFCGNPGLGKHRTCLGQRIRLCLRASKGQHSESLEYLKTFYKNKINI